MRIVGAQYLSIVSLRILIALVQVSILTTYERADSTELLSRILRGMP